MGRGPIRFSLRGAMVAVAVAGLALGAFRFLDEFRHSTLGNGPNTSVLSPGEEVRIIREVRSFDRVIPAGTPGVVVEDITDEDSAYPNRLVREEIEPAPEGERVINVKRIDLRVTRTTAGLMIVVALSALPLAWYAWSVWKGARLQADRPDAATGGGVLALESTKSREASHE